VLCCPLLFCAVLFCFGQYRAPLNFNPETLKAALNSLKRIDKIVAQLRLRAASTSTSISSATAAATTTSAAASTSAAVSDGSKLNFNAVKLRAEALERFVLQSNTHICRYCNCECELVVTIV